MIIAGRVARCYVEDGDHHEDVDAEVSTENRLA